MRSHHLLAASALLVLPAVAPAYSDGALDTGFGFGNGYVSWTGGGSVEVADVVAVGDGTLIGVGTYDAPSAAPVLHWQAFDKVGNQLTRACYPAPGSLFQNSVESHGLTAIVDSTGGLVVGGWHLDANAPTHQRALLARFVISGAGCVLDTTFNQPLGWRVDLSPLCDTEDCRIVDLLEVSTDALFPQAPWLVALMEQEAGFLTSRYYLVGITLQGDLRSLGFGVDGYAEVTAPGLGSLLAGSAHLDITGRGALEVAVSRFDPDASNDLDPAVLSFTAAGVLRTSFGTNGVLVVADDSEVDGVAQDQVVLANGRSASAWRTAAATGGAVSTYPRDGGAINHLGFSPVRSVHVAGQGDGKVVVAANVPPSSDDAFWVLRRDTSAFGIADPTFTEPYLDLDLGGSNGQEVTRVVLDAGRIVLGGTADASSTTTAGFLLRLRNSYLFADGFEWGTAFYWSAAVGLQLP